MIEPLRWWRDRHLSREVRLWKLRLFSLQSRRPREISSMCKNIWREGMKKREPNPTRYCPDRTRGNSCKFKHMKSNLIMEFLYFFFCCEDSERWHRLSRDTVESLSLEISKSCLDTVLGIWRRLNQTTSEDPFQLQPHSYSMKGSRML